MALERVATTTTRHSGGNTQVGQSTRKGSSSSTSNRTSTGTNRRTSVGKKTSDSTSRREATSTGIGSELRKGEDVTLAQAHVVKSIDRPGAQTNITYDDVGIRVTTRIVYPKGLGI